MRIIPGLIFLALFLSIFSPARAIGMNGFVKNQGQFQDIDGAPVLYRMDGKGASILVLENRLVQVRFSINEIGERYEVKSHRVDFVPMNAQPSFEVQSSNQLTHYAHYYLPHCPEGVEFVPAFGEILYKNVWPGIDWRIVQTKELEVKYEFIVAPGADPGDIQIELMGQLDQYIGEEGDLILTTSLGDIRDSPPNSWTIGSIGQTAVISGYSLDGPIVGFNIGEYPHSDTLIIDPWLNWSTYFGSTFLERAYDVVRDTSGNAWVIGSVASPTFPVTPGAAQGTFGGIQDMLACKFSPEGELLYATYYGGPDDDEALAGDIDASQAIWLAGHTHGSGWPTTPDAHQPFFLGVEDGLVLKLDSNGVRIYASHLGSSDNDDCTAVVVDDSNEVWIAGYTWGNDFPVSGDAIQSTYMGGFGDITLARMSETGSFEYGTYLGGSDLEEAWGITKDLEGNIWLTGFSSSNDIPVTLDAFQGSIVDDDDIYIAAISNAGDSLVYASYLGDSLDERAEEIVFGPDGNLWLAAHSESPGLTVSPTAWQPSNAGTRDALLIKWDPSTGPEYLTWLGGNSSDLTADVDVSENGWLWVTGYSYSTNFPVTHDAVKPTLGAGQSAVVFAFDTSGVLQYSTYLGEGNQEGTGICCLKEGGALAVGYSNINCAGGNGFPTFDPGNGAWYSGTLIGNYDIFLSRFGVPMAGSRGICFGCGVSADVSGSSSGCFGDTVSFINMSTDAWGAEWYFDGELYSNAFDGAGVLPTSGTARIKVLTYDSTCADTYAIMFTNHPLPILDLGPDSLFCGIDSVLLDAGAGMLTYEWQDSSTGQMLWVDSNGTYSVNVEDLNGCENSDSIMVSFGEAIGIPTITQFGDTLISSNAPFYQWYRDGSLLPGETDSLFVPSISGVYTVAVSNADSCSAFSDTLSVIITYIPAIHLSELHLYPNPTSGLIRIHWRGPPMVNFEIIDLSGKIISSGKLENDPLELDLGKFAAGLYNLRIWRGSKGISRNFLLRK